MLFSRTIWSDWRLLLAIPVAIFLRWVIDDAMFGDFEEKMAAELEADAAYPLDAPYRSPERAPVPKTERLFEDHAYRPDRDLPTATSGDSSFRIDPLAVALAGGGIVFVAGAFVAFRMWREDQDEGPEEDEP